MVAVGDLGRRRVDQLDLPRTTMSAKSTVERGELRRRRRALHAQHEPAVHEAQRVVVGVEAEDLVDRDVDVVGDAAPGDVSSGEM